MYVPNSRLYRPNTSVIYGLLEANEHPLAMVQIGMSSKVLTNKRLLFMDITDSKIKEFILLENISQFLFSTSMGIPRIDVEMRTGGVIKLGNIDPNWLDDVKSVFLSVFGEGGSSIPDSFKAPEPLVRDATPNTSGSEMAATNQQEMVRTNSTKEFPTWLQRSIQSHKGEGEEILMVITEPYTNHQGALLVFRDRCTIVKGGFWGGLMAGSLGGERAASFYFTQITGIEYNSGLINGVLEVLTPSYQASANKDFWKGTTQPRNADSNDPWTLSNTLPLTKEGYKSARSMIDELKRMIAESQRPQTGQSLQSPTSAADELAKIARLKAEGVLTEEEFLAMKKKLLGF